MDIRVRVRVRLHCKIRDFRQNFDISMLYIVKSAIFDKISTANCLSKFCRKSLFFAVLVMNSADIVPYITNPVELHFPLHYDFVIWHGVWRPSTSRIRELARCMETSTSRLRELARCMDTSTSRIRDLERSLNVEGLHTPGLSKVNRNL